MVASLLAATTVFGQNQNNSCQPPKAPPVCQPVKPTCQPQVCKPAKPAVCGIVQEPQVPTIAAYNAPAEINIGMQGEYDFFVTGTFIYWQPLLDNFSVGIQDSLTLADLTVHGLGARTNTIDMDFDYKPGFKVGLGMNLQHDDWVGYAEYTRIHGKHNVSSSSDSATPTIIATRGHPIFLQGIGQVYSSLHSKYTCNLDFIDGQLERVYYVGQNLVFHSSFGARGGWILQNQHTRYNGITNVGVPGPLPFAGNAETNIYDRVHSWAIGPKTGLKMDWIFGDGFRFYGNTFADLLYTKYKVQGKAVVLARSGNNAFGLTAGQFLAGTFRDKVAALRTHLDIEMGFGWGTYLDNNGWHVDFAVGYDFQVFFNQNMFTQFPSSTSPGINLEQLGNLYMQGLNVTARLDF